MTKIALKFKMTVDVESAHNLDEFGRELAIFLQETFDNGEDYLEVEYQGHDLII